MNTTSNIIDIIPFGKSNSVTAQSLAAQIDKNVRDVRRDIADARKSGKVIIATSDHKGYFRPHANEAQEVEHYIAESVKRANSILSGTTSARHWLRKLEGQQSFCFNGKETP